MAEKMVKVRLGTFLFEMAESKVAKLKMAQAAIKESREKQAQMPKQPVEEYAPHLKSI